VRSHADLARTDTPGEIGQELSVRQRPQAVARSCSRISVPYSAASKIDSVIPS
jgi:hypothetical protein